jgi:hypothetical protein
MPELSYSNTAASSGRAEYKMTRRLDVDSALASRVDGGLAWHEAARNASRVPVCPSAASGSQPRCRWEVRAALPRTGAHRLN